MSKSSYRPIQTQNHLKDAFLRAGLLYAQSLYNSSSSNIFGNNFTTEVFRKHKGYIDKLQTIKTQIAKQILVFSKHAKDMEEDINQLNKIMRIIKDNKQLPQEDRLKSISSNAKATLESLSLIQNILKDNLLFKQLKYDLSQYLKSDSIDSEYIPPTPFVPLKEYQKLININALLGLRESLQILKNIIDDHEYIQNHSDKLEPMDFAFIFNAEDINTQNQKSIKSNAISALTSLFPIAQQVDISYLSDILPQIISIAKTPDKGKELINQSFDLFTTFIDSVEKFDKLNEHTNTNLLLAHFLKSYLNPQNFLSSDIPKFESSPEYIEEQIQINNILIRFNNHLKTNEELKDKFKNFLTTTKEYLQSQNSKEIELPFSKMTDQTTTLSTKITLLNNNSLEITILDKNNKNPVKFIIDNNFELLKDGEKQSDLTSILPVIFLAYGKICNEQEIEQKESDQSTAIEEMPQNLEELLEYDSSSSRSQSPDSSLSNSQNNDLKTEPAKRPRSTSLPSSKEYIDSRARRASPGSEKNIDEQEIKQKESDQLNKSSTETIIAMSDPDDSSYYWDAISTDNDENSLEFLDANDSDSDEIDKNTMTIKSSQSLYYSKKNNDESGLLEKKRPRSSSLTSSKEFIAIRAGSASTGSDKNINEQGIKQDDLGSSSSISQVPPTNSLSTSQKNDNESGLLNSNQSETIEIKSKKYTFPRSTSPLYKKTMAVIGSIAAVAAITLVISVLIAGLFSPFTIGLVAVIGVIAVATIASTAAEIYYDHKENKHYKQASDTKEKNTINQEQSVTCSSSVEKIEWVKKAKKPSPSPESDISK